MAAQRYATPVTVGQGPPPGEVWLAGPALDRLDQAVGDTVTVGRRELRIGKVLVREPDQGAGFYSMNPRVLMNRDDVASTGVLAPGTRVQYELRIAAPGERMATVHEQPKPTLAAHPSVPYTPLTLPTTTE